MHNLSQLALLHVYKAASPGSWSPVPTVVGATRAGGGGATRRASTYSTVRSEEGAVCACRQSCTVSVSFHARCTREPAVA